jgi:hypothetical protein
MAKQSSSFRSSPYCQRARCFVQLQRLGFYAHRENRCSSFSPVTEWVPYAYWRTRR